MSTRERPFHSNVFTTFPRQSRDRTTPFAEDEPPRLPRGVRIAMALLLLCMLFGFAAGLSACGGTEEVVAVAEPRSTTQPIDCGGGITCRQ